MCVGGEAEMSGTYEGRCAEVGWVPRGVLKFTWCFETNMSRLKGNMFVREQVIKS